MIARIRIVLILLLAGITLAYLYQFTTMETLAALQEWRGRWPTLVVCWLINCAGVSLDYVGWRWMYHRCGMRVGGFIGAIIFLSTFAALLLPMQTGRMVRPEAAQRLGLGSLRSGIEAETALLYLDVSAAATLLAFLVTALLFPLGAPIVAALTLACALGSARFFSTYFGSRLSALRPELFWGIQGVATVLLRITDRALLGYALFLLVQPLLPSVSLLNTTLNVLLADSIGVASGMPGGLGVAEPLLGWLLALAQFPEAHIAIAVVLFRVVTYLGLLPFAWVALVYVQFAKPPARVDAAAPTP